MTADLPRDNAVRMERARADFCKGVTRPSHPGEIYYPTIPELAITYDLSESVMQNNVKDWLEARREAMTYSAITPFSAAVDANPEVVRRSDKVTRAVEEIDDLVFGLSKRALVIAELAVERLEQEAEDDPVRAIRALRSVSQTMESLHRTAKQAYDPASVRPENTVNINVHNLQANDDVVNKTIETLARIELEARARGIEIDNVIEGEVISEEDNDE